MVVVTVAEFKDLFDRGPWTYGSSLPAIRDKDITEAISEAETVFNHDLYPTEVIEKKALLHLAAHFLKNDLEGAASNGQSQYNVNSRSADGISESLTIPEWMNEGDFAMYATTPFGQKFLLISRPYLYGQVYSVPGATQP